MCGVIDLTPSQSVAIYGWRKPLRILNWKILLEREDLTFKKLYGIGLTEKPLFILQPDKMAWISEKRLELDDVILVPKWRVHVTRDMKATFVDIAQMNLSSDFLQHTGVTFEDLVKSGLTLNLMMLLPLTLIAWVHLGLHRDFLTDLTDVQSHALFHIPKNLVLQCVQEHTHTRNIDIENLV
jgi:flagellar biosynthesis protein FliQ